MRQVNWEEIERQTSRVRALINEGPNYGGIARVFNDFTVVADIINGETEVGILEDYLTSWCYWVSMPLNNVKPFVAHYTKDMKTKPKGKKTTVDEQ